MKPPTFPPTELPGLLAEFEDVANILVMPDDERAGIAGLPVAVWQQMTHGQYPIPAAEEARCVRRLRYSLPLLRRMVQNCATFSGASDGRATRGGGGRRRRSGLATAGAA